MWLNDRSIFEFSSRMLGVALIICPASPSCCHTSLPIIFKYYNRNNDQQLVIGGVATLPIPEPNVFVLLRELAFRNSLFANDSSLRNYVIGCNRILWWLRLKLSHSQSACQTVNHSFQWAAQLSAQRSETAEHFLSWFVQVFSPVRKYQLKI